MARTRGTEPKQEKHLKKVATRYDKTQRNYAAMVAIACTLTWLRL